MNQKNLLIVSIIANVFLIALIFYVKGNATAQAQEFVKPIQEKARYQIAQVKDITDNNNLLWTLIDSTWKSPDKSKAFVKKLAETQKVPRCGGKECAETDDGAKLKVDISDKATDRSITVGWGSGKNTKYFFKVIYDDKGNFATIDANDLLGKSPSQETAESAE